MAYMILSAGSECPGCLKRQTELVVCAVVDGWRACLLVGVVGVVVQTVCFERVQCDSRLGVRDSGLGVWWNRGVEGLGVSSGVWGDG